MTYFAKMHLETPEEHKARNDQWHDAWKNK